MYQISRELDNAFVFYNNFHKLHKKKKEKKPKKLFEVHILETPYVI